MDFDRLLSDIGQLASDALKDTMKEKGLNASMETSNSIEFVVNSSGVSVIANESIFALVNGRGPTTQQDGNGELLKKIKAWVKFKGIDEQWVYAIKNKIHKEGIEVPNQYNDGRLFQDSFDEKLDKGITELIKKYVNSIE